MPRRLILLGLAVLLTSCGAVIPPVTPDLVAQATSRGLTTNFAQLTRGRDLYVTRCTTCHRLHDPTDKTLSQWPAVLAIMGPRAYLPDHQRADVLAFLQSTAAIDRDSGAPR